MDFVSAKIKAAPENTAKFYLHRHYTKLRPNRSKLAIHASDLYGDWESFCPRERGLRWLHQTESEPEKINTSLRVTFELGKMVHGLVVQGLALEGVAVMDWECLRCGAVYHRRTLPPYCDKCEANKALLKPHELKFKSPISGVTGSIDCFLDSAQSRLLSVEIKSIDKEEFKGLVMPKSEHRWRTQLYLRILGECAVEDPWIAENVNLDQGIVIYVSKGGYGVKDPGVYNYGWQEQFSPFKEYRVGRNDANSDSQVAQAMEYKAYRADPKPDGSTMPGRICGTPAVKRAQRCAMRGACFMKEGKS